MRDPVLGLIGLWRHSIIDVQCVGMMGAVPAAIVNMDMSSHRYANHIA